MLGVGLVLSACGGDVAKSGEEPATSASVEDTPDAAPSTEAPAWPTCAEAWAPGARLARGYQGCLDGEATVRADKQRCSSGQVLVTYADRYYAMVGGPVNETDGLRKDRGYRQAFKACVA